MRDLLLSVGSIFSEHQNYWIARFLFYRGLFLTYFLAFLVAYRQFCPLAGVNGLKPFPRLLKNRGPWNHPTLLHWFDSDQAVKGIAVTGLIVSSAGFFGLEWLGTWAVGVGLFVLWGLYLSLVKAGGLFYGFGWESFLLETGFLAIFLGGAHRPVSPVMSFLAAWLLFRVMFGAGLIKLRGDECWWDLTCMDYHYETQPMPNPLSWFAHQLPKGWHKIEVLGNHITEVAVPFLYFAPQPVSGIGALMTVGFQGWLMLTGNFSWLNFLTGVLAILLIPDSFFTALVANPGLPETVALHPIHQYAIYGYALLVLFLSYYPAKNLFSSRQLMNAGFDSFNLVNTYGAFGSITKVRNELVVEGRREGEEWRTYEFKGKPTDPNRRPPQWAPYHLRLDWQMWFAAMRHRPPYWLLPMLKKLMDQDEDFRQLIREDPFEGQDPPDEIRIRRFKYEFTDPGSDSWWNRTFVDEYLPPMNERELEHRLR